MKSTIRFFFALLVMLISSTTAWAQYGSRNLLEVGDVRVSWNDRGTVTQAVAVLQNCEDNYITVTVKVKPDAGYYTRHDLITFKDYPSETTTYTPNSHSGADEVVGTDEKTISYIIKGTTVDGISVNVSFVGIGNLELKSNLGTNAGVTFYDGGTSAPDPTAFDPINYNADNAISIISSSNRSNNDRYIIAHVVPNTGYWTNEALLYGKELYDVKIVSGPIGTRSMSIDGTNDVTLLKADEDRYDGAGWYCYKIPKEHFSDINYTASALEGFLVPKFDLSTATVSSDGKTYTVTQGDWSTSIETDGKTSFAYNGLGQAPQITSTTITAKRGTIAPTFSPVDKQVTMVVGGGEAVNVGSYTATLTAITTAASATTAAVSTGIFINSKDIPFSITKKDMNTDPTGNQNKMTVKVNPTSFIYNGTKQVPEVKVYDGEGDNAKEIPATEYDVSYKYKSDGTAVTDPTKAAVYTIVISDKAGKTNGNYNIVGGTAEFEITAKEVGLSWDKTSFTYDTKAQQPVATVTGLVTVNGQTDACKVTTYKVEAKDGSSLTDGKAVNVGSYKVTATALDNTNYKLPSAASTDFIIDQEGTFTISFDASIADEYYIYDGTAKEPAVVVKDGDITLTKDQDYEVVYENNINAGENTASVKVTAKGNFQGTKTAKFSIKKATLKIKADAKEKYFGDADPALTYTSEGLITGDAITGALTRDEGEDVGTYDIKQGTLTAGNNYTIEYTGAKLTIKAAEPTPGPIDPDPIIPDPATVVVTIKGHINTAVYDGAEHSVSGYDVSISNAQYKESDFTFTGEAKAACTDAGIAYMGVTVTQFTNKNNSFIVTFEVEDGYMQIDPRNITVSVADKSVEYNGSEQSGNTSYTFSNVVDGQTATITYTPAKGTSAGTYDNGSFANDLKVMSGSKDVTANYSLKTMTKGKLIITSLDHENFKVSFDANLDNVVYDGNGQKPKVIVKDGDKTLVEGQDYTLTYNQNVNAGVAYVTVTGIGNYAGSSATKSFTIGKKPLTIKADAKTKVTGEADPALTYTSEGLVAGDKITGALTRDAGEAAGTYAIKQGTLSAGDNYAITYVGANLTITETVMPDVPTPPALTLYNITVVPATGGEILTSDTQAEAGKQINLIVNTTKGYHLTNIIVSTVSGASVSTFVAFDAQGNAYYAFLMPSADVIVKSIFEADQPDQNIFICKAKYGEVISHLLHADPGQQVNLRALLGEDVELDQLKVVNSKGEELKIYTIMDPTEGLIYFFFMRGDQVVIYDSFKGTNGTVDESQPVQPDNLLYLMSDIYNGFIKTSDGVEGVQMAMSLVANILAKFTPEGELSVKVGEDDLNIALLNLQSGWQIKFDFTGLINVLNPKMLGLTDGATLKSGQIYNILTSGMLELLIPSTYMPLLLQAITIMGPEPDPTAIYGLKADGTAVDLYDLRGRKVDTTNLRKGIYIHDGRKVVIK